MSRKLAAEFFGTFWLVFGGCGSAVLAAAFVTGWAEDGTVRRDGFDLHYRTEGSGTPAVRLGWARAALAWTRGQPAMAAGGLPRPPPT